MVQVLFLLGDPKYPYNNINLVSGPFLDEEVRQSENDLPAYIAKLAKCYWASNIITPTHHTSTLTQKKLDA